MTGDSLYLQLKSTLLNQSPFDFEATALDVFRFQAIANPIYARYLEILGVQASQIDNVQNIPCLPIETFKYQEVKSGHWEPQTVFRSSGTTLDAFSKHYVRDLNFYHDLAIETFESQFFPLEDVCILGLLPNYLEAGDSSLVSMVTAFQQKSGHPDSGFFLYDFAALAELLERQNQKAGNTILFGVTYALLDFAASFPQKLQDHITVIETGGMKGRGKEMDRTALHAQLRSSLGTDRIYSEYGMTEMFSQAYAPAGGTYQGSRLLRTWMREINDPFQEVKHGKVGVINVIDLANIDTCSFIATGDLGRSEDGITFEVLGRMDDADLRGCQLRYLER